MTDPYLVLGVAKTATDKEIKQAYKKLAMQHHPDRGGDGDKFAEINNAYDAIKDQESRDRLYEEKFQQQQDPWHGFEDIFAQHFGGQNPFRQQVRNQDIHVTFYATLEDVYNSASKDIQVRFKNKVKNVTIRIPKGIADGTEVRYTGYGDDSVPNVQPGSLFVTYRFKSHPDYHVEEYDLVKRLNISIREAMLGSDRVIHTLDGRTLRLNIKPGTQSKTRLRIPEGGLPRRNLPNGNLYVEITVDIPKLTLEDLEKPLKDIL